jgi:subtilisin family serine protease
MRRDLVSLHTRAPREVMQLAIARDIRWLVMLALALVALIAVPHAAHAAARVPQPADAALVHASPNAAFMTGHILVGMKAGADEIAITNALAKHGAHSRGKIAGTQTHVVDVTPGSEEAAVESLRSDPDVEFAELDRVIHADGTANDPMYGSEWHLAKIGAPSAWDYSTGAGITIAILDTGVDGTHPDLASKMVPGWNFYSNNSDTSDVNGHGTTVAGAAAAATNNSIGVASVAGGAKIMPIRISDANAYATWSAAAQGITYAADHGARVVNLSFGGASGSSTVQQAASYLRSKGGVLFVAAGNTGAVDNTAPTDLMLVVAATLQDDSHASWSTYGSFVDISAPGYNIVSTARGAQYWYCWGTSLATPIVSGTAALILSKRPDFTSAQVDATLKASATDLGALGADPYFGAGRVNAAAAVQRAIATPVADTTKPTVAIASPTGGTVTGTITVTANASDNVGVTRVELRANGVLVASDTAAPYQFAWNTASAANGGVQLTATAYDAAGNSAVSAPVAVTVSNTLVATTDTTPPTVSIAAPTGGTVGGTITVSVNATDNVGVARVDLLVNGVLLGSSNVAPYRFSWNTTSVANGSATLTARAYDKAGNSRLSSVVTVTVSNATGGTKTSDTTAPVVTIQAPANGSLIGSSVNVKATASDDSGSTALTLRVYLDGALKTTITGTSVSVNWNMRKAGAGLHTILVTATDPSGNTGTSQVQVTK